MDFNEYQALAARTMKKGRTFYEDLADYALGLSEAGEAQNIIKKYLYHGHILDRLKVIEELGDLLWYISSITITIGFKLEDVAAYNIDKLRKRYPDGYSDERSRDRVV